MSNHDFHTAYLPTSSRRRSRKLITLKRVIIAAIIVAAIYFLYLELL